MSGYTYREPSLRYKVFTNLIIAVFILFIILGSFFLIPIIGNIPFFFVVLIFLTVLIFFHSKKTAYICRNCNHEFEITFWQDLISTHAPGQKMLKCPKCSYKDYCSEVIKLKLKNTI